MRLVEEVSLKRTEREQNYQSKRNPIAKDLKTSRQYRQRIIKNKKKYDRKDGNKFLEDFKRIFESW